MSSPGCARAYARAASIGRHESSVCWRCAKRSTCPTMVPSRGVWKPARSARGIATAWTARRAHNADVSDDKRSAGAGGTGCPGSKGTGTQLRRGGSAFALASSAPPDIERLPMPLRARPKPHLSRVPLGRLDVAVLLAWSVGGGLYRSATRSRLDRWFFTVSVGTMSGSLQSSPASALVTVTPGACEPTRPSPPRAIVIRAGTAVNGRGAFPMGRRCARRLTCYASIQRLNDRDIITNARLRPQPLHQGRRLLVGARLSTSSSCILTTLKASGGGGGSKNRLGLSSPIGRTNDTLSVGNIAC